MGNIKIRNLDSTDDNTITDNSFLAIALNENDLKKDSTEQNARLTVKTTISQLSKAILPSIGNSPPISENEEGGIDIGIGEVVFGEDGAPLPEQPPVIIKQGGKEQINISDNGISLKENTIVEGGSFTTSSSTTTLFKGPNTFGDPNNPNVQTNFVGTTNITGPLNLKDPMFSDAGTAPTPSSGKLYRLGESLYFNGSKVLTEGEGGKWLDGTSSSSIYYNGKVGIGHDNPGTPLTIRGTGTTDYVAMKTSLGGVNESLYYTDWKAAGGFKVIRAPGTQGSLDIGINTPDGTAFSGSGGHITFSTNSSGTYDKRLIINSDGSLSIKNSVAPTTTENKLYAVAGDIYWDGKKIFAAASSGSGGGSTDSLPSNTVSTDSIADDAVDSDKIKDGAVDTTHLSQTLQAQLAAAASGYTHPNHTGDVSSVGDGTTSIGTGKVTSAKIAVGAVTSAKIADDAVTLDKLNDDIVDPSGGIEIGANGLKLATSANATKVQLHVNSSTGVAFVNGTSHQDRTSGFIVTDKFLNVTDATTWMAYNLASTSIRVDLIIETDTTESFDGQYWWRTNASRYGNINIWGKPLYDQHPWTTPPSSAITNPTITVNVDQNSSASSRFMVWAENVITIRGVNWTFNMGSKSNEFHALFRALGNASRVTFSYNKVKATSNSGTRLPRGFESVNGGMIRITSDLFNKNADRYDPLGNGGRAHGLELDIVGVPLVDNLFAVANGASFELIEFRPDTTTDLSGLHFVGSGTVNIGNVFYMQAGGRVETNSKVTRSTSTTMSGGSVVRAIGYNSVFFNAYSEDTDATPSGGTSAFPKLPANSAFHSSSATPADYIVSTAFQASNTATGPVATNSLDTEPNYL